MFMTTYWVSIQKGNRVLGRCKKDFRLKFDETQQHLIHGTWSVKIHSAKHMVCSVPLFEENNMHAGRAHMHTTFLKFSPCWPVNDVILTNGTLDWSTSIPTIKVENKQTNKQTTSPDQCSRSMFLSPTGTTVELDISVFPTLISWMCLEPDRLFRYSTLASLQKPRGRSSSCTTTMTPTAMAVGLVLLAERRCESWSSISYSFFHLRQKWFITLQRCFAVFFGSVDESSKSGSDKSPVMLWSGRLNNLRPWSRCDGVSGLSMSPEDT